MTTVSYRAYLEVREPDGRTEFISTDEILRSPDLQERCTEKRTLHAIVAKLKKQGVLRETLVSAGPSTMQ
jgi:hypothetical protein